MDRNRISYPYPTGKPSLVAAAAVPTQSPPVIVVHAYLGIWGLGSYHCWRTPGTYYWRCGMSRRHRVRCMGGGGWGNRYGGGGGGGYTHGYWDLTAGHLYTILVGGVGIGLAGGLSSFDILCSATGGGICPGSGLWAPGGYGYGGDGYQGMVANGGRGGYILSGGGGGWGGGGAGSHLGDGGDGGCDGSGGHAGGGGGAGSGHGAPAGPTWAGGGGSAFGIASQIGVNGAPNDRGLITGPTVNNSNGVVRFELDGFYGGGGIGASATLGIGGPGGGGGGGSNASGATGNGYAGGICGGGGGCGSLGSAAGWAGIGGGGGGAPGVATLGGGGNGIIIIEY